MEPRIENVAEKKLVGIRLIMSLENNKTGELWKSFMARRNEIKDQLSRELFSLQVYPPPYFRNFNPANLFEKWALVEVTHFEPLGAGLETYTLKGGLYAVFTYQGSSTDTKIFQFIFSDWLPNSEYLLDNRPHFELLGEKYKTGDPDSEEEIWIPIKPKA